MVTWSVGQSELTEACIPDPKGLLKGRRAEGGREGGAGWRWNVIRRNLVGSSPTKFSSTGYCRMTLKHLRILWVQALHTFHSLDRMGLKCHKSWWVRASPTNYSATGSNLDSNKIIISRRSKNLSPLSRRWEVEIVNFGSPNKPLFRPN